MIQEFWRHRASGEVWAVELRAGVPVRAMGPLLVTRSWEVFAARDWFCLGNGRFLASHSDSFELHEVGGVIRREVRDG